MQGTGNPSLRTCNVVQENQANMPRKWTYQGNVVRANQANMPMKWTYQGNDVVLANQANMPITMDIPRQRRAGKPSQHAKEMTYQGNVVLGTHARYARTGDVVRTNQAKLPRNGQTKANTQVNVRLLLVETVWGFKTCVFFTSVMKNTSKYGDLASG